MTRPLRPGVRPDHSHFSSGPCAKRPGWSLTHLTAAVLGRSHRSKPGKAKLKLALDMTREILKIPDDYLIAIVPGSDTGAIEMALWSLLGPRGVDILAWESFGKGWAQDIMAELKLPDVRFIQADYGALPDLTSVDFDRDVIFTWNGTTSGVCVPNGDWISDRRLGLTLCDATSAVFAQNLDWSKLDVTSYSWQKVLGSEAAHGMLILSPRAVARLESYRPPWPMPKLFRLTKNGKLIKGIFEGLTINTPSLLCVEDYLDALNWAQGLGGLKAMVARADANFAVIERFVAEREWIDFLALLPCIRSNTSVCLKIIDPDILSLPLEGQAKFAKKIAALLDEENVAKDIGSYRDAPPGLRIWAGATIETSDIAALMPWLDWAFATAKQELEKIYPSGKKHDAICSDC